MRTVGIILVICLVGCGSPATPPPAKPQAAAPQPAPKKDTTNRDKLVGTWEIAKSTEGLVGTSMEFTRDGKLIMTAKAGEQTVKVEGSYTVDGDSLTIVQNVGGQEVRETTKIRQLTDKTLTTVDAKGQSEEFKRK